MTSVSSSTSLFSSCLDDLSIGQSGVLKSPTIIVWGSICNLCYINNSLASLGAFVFDAWILRIVMSSDGIFLWWLFAYLSTFIVNTRHHIGDLQWPRPWVVSRITLIENMYLFSLHLTTTGMHRQIFIKVGCHPNNRPRSFPQGQGTGGEFFPTAASVSSPKAQNPRNELSDFPPCTQCFPIQRFLNINCT